MENKWSLELNLPILERKMADIFSVAGILLLLLVLALVYYSGFLEVVEVSAGRPPISKAVVAYKFQRGPYKGAFHLGREVSRLAPRCTSIGIYYDDPKQVPEDKLKYAVGAILSEGNSAVDVTLRDAMIREGFHLITLPAVSRAVKAAFPYRGFLSMMVAIYKVYPKIEQFVREHRLLAYPCLEIYDKDTIYFMAPLASQDEFFVDESK